MLADPKLSAFLKKAIAALECDIKDKAISTVDTAYLSGKIEAFKEILNEQYKKPKRKIKFFK